MLRLLDRYEVRATFFVLGWVANRFPQLIKEIHREGHEIASHGYWHRLVYQQTPDDFRSDLRRSREVLEQLTGTAVVAYRAPSFSITERSRWALQILVEEGFTIDSSIFPVRHDRYGIPGAERHIHEIHTSAGTLWEFPPSVTRIAGCNVPVGGGYFRLYPWHLTRHCLRRINRHARIVICGAISQYNATAKPVGPANYLSLLVNRARMEGIVVFDNADRYGIAIAELAGYLKDGRMKSREDVVSGLDTFPEALLKLFRGENFGKLVLQVAEG
jgi:predicted deacetylase